MLAVHEHGGKYSICCETGIIAQNVDRYQAVDAITATVTDISEAEIFELLDTPTDPAVFRTVWSAAVTSSLLELESDVESLPNAETVNHVLDRQARLFTAVSELQRELLRSTLKTKIKELEAVVEGMAARCIAALAERGIVAGADVASWNAAMSSDLGLQLVELREKLNET